MYCLNDTVRDSRDSLNIIHRGNACIAVDPFMRRVNYRVIAIISTPFLGTLYVELPLSALKEC